jgi:NTE family protein
MNMCLTDDNKVYKTTSVGYSWSWLPSLNAKTCLRAMAAFLVMLLKCSSANADEVATGTDTTSRPRVALVLGGGGLRGVAQIGVLRILQREKIPIDLVVGTSMGAIIGGLFCAGVGTQQLEDAIVPKYISHTFPLGVQALKAPLSLLFMRNPQALISGKNVVKFVHAQVASDRYEIGSLSPKFAAVATDLIEGRTQVITHGDLGTALQASSAIPLLMSPVAFDDALLIDGGTICNLPVQEAKSLGADFVIVVDVDEKIKHIAPIVFRKKFGSVPSRVLTLMLTKIDEAQKAEADICIQPDVTGISLLSRKKSDANQALDAGTQAAEAVIPELKRKLALVGIKL